MLDQMEKERIIQYYCKDNCKKLNQLCHSLFRKMGGISQMDHDDLYDIGSDVLLDTLSRYEEGRGINFNTFLMGNITKKYCTYMRDQLTDKRADIEKYTDPQTGKVTRRKIQDIRLNAISEDNDEEYGTNIPSAFDIFQELDYFYIDKIELYMNRLSRLQIRIVNLLAEGYKGDEIRDLLGISSKVYAENLKAIRSYENVKLLY